MGTDSVHFDIDTVRERGTMKIRRRSFLCALLGANLPLLAAFMDSPALATSRVLNIVVYGGTGRIGSRIVAEARGRADHVTVVVRAPKTGSVPVGVALVPGDVLDSNAVARQISGQDVVISAVSGGFRGPSEVKQFQVEVAHSLIAALRSLKSRAPRLIVVGGASSLLLAPGKRVLDSGPQADPDSEMVTLTRALDYYRTVHDVDWTFVSPPPGLEIRSNERTGKYRVGGDYVLRDAEGQPARISVADFAVAIVDEAERPQHIQRRFTVAY